MQEAAAMSTCTTTGSWLVIQSTRRALGSSGERAAYLWKSRRQWSDRRTMGKQQSSNPLGLQGNCNKLSCLGLATNLELQK